jgi:capsular polysaccharide biosynthesis protein
MDHSSSVLRSDDAPLPDPDESPSAGASRRRAGGAQPDTDLAMHLDGQPLDHARDPAPPDADARSDAPSDAAAPPSSAAPTDAETGADAETTADTEDPTDQTVGPYPDDSLWPAHGVRALRAQGLGAELTPRSTVDPVPLLPRDRSDAYPMAPGSVDPRTFGVPERVRRPRPMALVLTAIAVVLAFVGASVGYSLLVQQKLYGAQAAFQLTTRPDMSDTAVDLAQQTQLLILTGPSILQPVATQTGVSLSTLQDEVSAGILGRSNVMQITVADPDQQQAVRIAAAVADRYQRVTPKTTAAVQTVPVTVSPLTAARALGQLQPQPMRALAVGVLVGLLAAAIVVVVLCRPWSVRRPAPYWT